MKNIVAIIVSLVLFVGASAQITPAKKTFYYKKNAQLLIKQSDEPVVEVSIGAGNNLVFFYEWQSPKNPQLADADRTDKLYFEITPEQAKSFQASGTELSKVSTIRCRLCFCLEGGCRKNVQGELTVKKVSCGKYQVTFKDDPDSERFLVNETFALRKGA